MNDFGDDDSHQTGVTYFVTFRTDDSVPQSLLQSWHARRNDWLRRHGLDPSAGDWKTKLQADPACEREYHAKFSREFMAYLDQGHGACVLRQPEVAKIVADSLQHFDGDRYHLGDFVVMPNHVHLLTCLCGTTEIESQCHSWKKFTATKINKLLGRQGRFWQAESFDHLIRTPEQFDYLRRYIAENPTHAHLLAGEYLYGRRDMQLK